MYAGCESPGGPCEESNCRLFKCEFNDLCVADGYEKTISCNCGENRAAFEGAVPSLEQVSAQHNRAVAVSAFPEGIIAASQQDMSPIAWSMMQDCSPNGIGTPATVLPLKTTSNIRDVSRIRMTV